jgi:peptidoglycan/LPS O-acetylase OafA/YrhL
MPELDAIRGLAILAVLFHHGIYMPTLGVALPRWQHLLVLATWTGRLGVNLFFVLSGFLITGILLDSWQKPDYYKRFYIRRARRIFPIYFVVLGVLYLESYSKGFLAISFVYLSNFAPFFGLGLEYNVIWSLAVEEHFYLLWPALVRRLSLAALWWICVSVVLASPLVRLINSKMGNSGGMDWTFYTWNNFDGLALGALLALLIRKSNQNRDALTRACWISFALAIAIWAVGLPFGIITRHRAVGAALQVVPWQFLFFSLTGAFLLIGTTGRKRFVQSKVLIFFGYISYGLYLIHNLLLFGFDSVSRRIHVLGLGHGTMSDVTVRFLYAGSAAILIAWLSRKYFEEPFLRLKRPEVEGKVLDAHK